MTRAEYYAMLQQATGVPLWVLVVIGVVMFGSWTLAYAFIIIKCFREKTYGFPVLGTGWDIGWEMIYSFDLVCPLPYFVFPLKWGHRAWLAPDAFNVVQALLYGKSAQTHSWVRKHWYPLAIVALTIPPVGIYAFIVYTRDFYGVASSFTMNLSNSILFIVMYLNRPDLKGLSYAGAWLKMIGTFAGAVFCVLWWPAQFQNGMLVNPFNDPRLVGVEEPTSYLYVNMLYFLIPMVDCLYIYLLWKRRRELREQGAGAAA